MDVSSEIGVLRRVLVHEPGLEWDLVPCGPKALERYLIEDIFVLKQARQEHERFTDILGLFIGPENVLKLENLLGEVCADESTRRELVAAVSAQESLGRATAERLLALAPAGLAKASEQIASVLIGRIRTGGWK